MSYDAEWRRDTPLAVQLRERIGRDGPISIADYMRSCLYDARYGYYQSRIAIGRAGDFVTAPEISQIFGELVGLWCVVAWQQMGSPDRIELVELGPGRGTLIRDALRAARAVRGFLSAVVQVRLVEPSAVLQGIQRRTLADVGVPLTWVPNLGRPVDRACCAIPAIIIANERLDCEPRDQHISRQGEWYVRKVAADRHGRLTFDEAALSGVAGRGLGRAFPGAGDGDVVEPCHPGWLDEITGRWPAMAALFIDYGFTGPMTGDTLQAVREHRYEHPLTSPGEADLTMQVDFGALLRQCRSRPELGVDGPVTQAELLGALGIIERASRLMAANPGQAASIEAGVARLMLPNGMGTRFKAIGIRSAHLPPLPGLAAMDNSGPAP